LSVFLAWNQANKLGLIKTKLQDDEEDQLLTKQTGALEKKCQRRESGEVMMYSE
jgi:hypothetical protein